jgi:hypothetical protein
MRLVSICLATACLALTSLLAAYAVTQGSVSAQFVGDATLARALGTNVGQNGNGSYSCDDANAGAGQYTQSGCNALNPVPSGAICVQCSDVSGSGLLTNGQGGPIVFTGSFSCTVGNPNTSKKLTTNCEDGVNGGYCVNFIPTGKCTGSFNQWIVQSPPTGGGGGD